MSYKAINLFNAYDLQPNPYMPAGIDVQAVVNYCEARFRAALQAMLEATAEDQNWMVKTIFRELVSFLKSDCFTFIPVCVSRNAASRTSELRQRSGDQSTSRSSFGRLGMNCTSRGTNHFPISNSTPTSLHIWLET